MIIVVDVRLIRDEFPNVYHIVYFLSFKNICIDIKAYSSSSGIILDVQIISYLLIRPRFYAQIYDDAIQFQMVFVDLTAVALG